MENILTVYLHENSGIAHSLCKIYNFSKFILFSYDVIFNREKDM